MWNDTELKHDVENELCWELSAGLKQISVAVKSGAVELAGHVDTRERRHECIGCNRDLTGLRRKAMPKRVVMRDDLRPGSGGSSRAGRSALVSSASGCSSA